MREEGRKRAREGESEGGRETVREEGRERGRNGDWPEEGGRGDVGND